MAGLQILVLVDEHGEKHLVSLDEPMARITGLGVIAAEKLRANLGRRISIGDRAVLALPASRRDRVEGLERRAQTIGSKDAASIVYNADLGPGDTVVEAGAGSGWLTVAIADSLGPTGRVVSYEVRPDYAAFVRENVRRAGFSDRVEIRVADITQGIAEHDVDAVVVDIAVPWTVVPGAWDALRVGGTFASFSPNVEQVRQTVQALAERPFFEVRTIEIIERALEVRELGTRPSQAPLGHTGYLTFARKVLDTF
jgi:tRNA (adenine57-N1/adenine58-N1)-methyltransferase